MKPGEFTEIEVPPGKTLAECLPARPLGVVAEAAISKMAAEGAAGPAALVAWLLVTLAEKLQRKGYVDATVSADFSSANGQLWRLHVTADYDPSLFRRYAVVNLDEAIAAADEWIGGLPAAADLAQPSGEIR